MNPKLSRAALLYSVLVSLPSDATATVIYQDLHLVPAYAKAHGLVMSIAFVILMPLGALLIRVLNSKRSVWIHASCQLLSCVLVLVGLATGIRLGKIIDILYNNAHTTLGTIIVALLLIQPFIGLIHHRRFLATRKRTAWTYIHVWYGRILILLGIINGGLGLQLAGNTKAGKIVYGVIAGLVGAACCMLVMMRELRRVSQTTSDIALEERSKSQTP